MKAKTKKAFLFLSFFLIGFLLLIVSLKVSQSNKAEISHEIREKFKKQLKKLPPPPFKKALGYEITKAEANLGRLLFNDPVLSRNNDVSCATCHLTNHGFADGNRLNFGALGAGGPTGNNVGKKWGTGELSLNRFCSDDGFGFYCDDPMFRNTLSTINVIYRARPETDSGLLWDGRFGRLAFQALLPVHTREEMCGVNPVPTKNNPFKKNGPLFDHPVKVTHSHLYDFGSGKQIFTFNSPPQTIPSIESFRKTGNIVYPSRNECVAIAVAKIRKIPYYQRKFKKIYQSKVTDILIGKALAAFVSTHVANNSPYDRFVTGHNVLSVKQLKGLAIFMTPVGKTVIINNQKVQGAGCAHCHSPPFFGGSGFYTLGIKGDDRSSLSKPGVIAENSGFAINIQTTHGKLPSCHIAEVSASVTTASPDIGRGIATSNIKDCFKFRTPTLRNVIETYPYFHHGTETGLSTYIDHSHLNTIYQVNEKKTQKHFRSKTIKNFQNISLYALQRAIEYHLRGPIDVAKINSLQPSKIFFDSFFQIDPLIPSLFMKFGPLESTNHYPVNLDKTSLDALLDFVAFGLYDKDAIRRGYLNNRLSHPRRVPSGFLPSITRDHGKQTELPPNGRFKRGLSAPLENGKGG